MCASASPAAGLPIDLPQAASWWVKDFKPYQDGRMNPAPQGKELALWDPDPAWILYTLFFWNEESSVQKPNDVQG